MGDVARRHRVRPRGLGVRRPGDLVRGRRLGGDVPGHPPRRGRSPMIACTPGLQLRPLVPGDRDGGRPTSRSTGRSSPRPARRGRRAPSSGGHGEDGVLVTVAGPDHDTVADVLATVQAVADGVDPHGCSVVDDGGPGMARGRFRVGLPVRRGRRPGPERAAHGAMTPRTPSKPCSATPLRRAAATCQNGPTEYVVMGVDGQRVEVQYAGNGRSASTAASSSRAVRHEIADRTSSTGRSRPAGPARSTAAYRWPERAAGLDAGRR